MLPRYRDPMDDSELIFYDPSNFLSNQKIIVMGQRSISIRVIRFSVIAKGGCDTVGHSLFSRRERDDEASLYYAVPRGHLPTTRVGVVVFVAAGGERCCSIVLTRLLSFTVFGL